MCCTHKEDFEHVYVPHTLTKGGAGRFPDGCKCQHENVGVGLHLHIWTVSLMKALPLKRTGLSIPVWGPIYMQVHLEYSYLLLHRERQFPRWEEIGDGGFLPIKT